MDVSLLKSVEDFIDPNFDPTVYTADLVTSLGEFEIRKKSNQLKTTTARIDREIHQTIYKNYDSIITQFKSFFDNSKLAEEDLKDLETSLRSSKKYLNKMLEEVKTKLDFQTPVSETENFTNNPTLVKKIDMFLSILHSEGCQSATKYLITSFDEEEMSSEKVRKIMLWEYFCFLEFKLLSSEPTQVFQSLSLLTSLPHSLPTQSILKLFSFYLASSCETLTNTYSKSFSDALPNTFESVIFSTESFIADFEEVHERGTDFLGSFEETSFNSELLSQCCRIFVREVSSVFSIYEKYFSEIFLNSLVEIKSASPKDYFSLISFLLKKSTSRPKHDAKLVSVLEETLHIWTEFSSTRNPFSLPFIDILLSLISNL